ncbi:hypothetical protein ES708_27172 [subsurface metagenome]
MELKNFTEIKAIDEARAKKIIKCYEKMRYKVAFSASLEGPGANLDSRLLIRLLTIFGNSKNLKKDFSQLDNELFGEFGKN